MMLKMRLSLLLFFLIGIASCKTGGERIASARETSTFQVTILYPNGEGKTFDMTYYEQKHMPMVAGLLGSNLQFYEIAKGLSGRTPNDKAPYLAIGFFYVKDVAAYTSAIAQNRDAIVGDFKNYTNIQPVIQISEVKAVKQTSKK